MRKNQLWSLLLVAGIALLVLVACSGGGETPAPTEEPEAEEEMATQEMTGEEEATMEVPAESAMQPSVTVEDQDASNGSVTIAKAVSQGPGWMVIHSDADGAPGPVVGYAPLADGENADVTVEIDLTQATPVLYAMLHTDAGTVGEYEFPGPDGPVQDAEGNVITPPFNATLPTGGEAAASIDNGNVNGDDGNMNGDDGNMNGDDNGGGDDD